MMNFFFSAIGSDQNTAGEGCPRGKGDIGIFKPGQVHLDKGYLYQNTTFVFVFGKGHIGPSSLEQRMSSENVIFSLFLEFSNRAKFTRRIEIDTKILPTD